MKSSRSKPRPWRARTGAWFKSAFYVVAGRFVVALLRGVRRMDPDRAADIGGALLRRIGPWLPEHRTGRANLAAAYPEKPPQEIEAIVRGVWDNLGRVAAEYAHLDRLWDFDAANPKPGRVEVPPASLAHFFRMRDDGKPALMFTAHLANWELLALGSAWNGLDTAILYRTPNIGDVAAAVRAMRASGMGLLIPTGIGAPSAAAAALERGLHVGILVDQHFHHGVDVTFFGRRCKANPMVARLARHFDCPIFGARVIRLPTHRFRIDISDAIEPPRDDEGKVDVQATTQMITSIVEGWVREHPEQWLWLHRRWR